MLRSNSELAVDEILACRIGQEISLDAQHPAVEWTEAMPLSFCSDWRGQDADPPRQTEVRALWTPSTLYLRFVCRYRDMFVFVDSDAHGRRDALWERDVAEAFLQPDLSRPDFYKEFEVSPNGMWVDLDIFPGGRSDLKSGLTRSIRVDPDRHTWAAELSIPMRSLTAVFDPAVIWRANFFRVEGPKEPRFYSAWRPTGTPQPNFHVPKAFGKLRFAEK
jgi:alpha-galactosidase